MSKQGQIHRYALIVQKLNRKHYPSLSDILGFLHDQEFEVSRRTLQRDIEDIRYEFGLDVKYSNSRRGYYIEAESSINIDSFIRFLDIVMTAELITESLVDCKETLNYIEFESEGQLYGIENLKPLLRSIKSKRIVKFSYQKFDSEKNRIKTIKPFLLKEYQQRWYIVGINANNNWRTYGIDRISDIEVTTQTFKPQKGTNPKELFFHTVGLIHDQQDPEEVKLSFTHLQGQYIKTLPLHQSQNIISETAQEVIATLWIRPNFEFKQKLLMMGASVKVLHPQWFVNEIKEELRCSINNYV